MNSRKQYYEGLTLAAKPISEQIEQLQAIEGMLKEECLSRIGKKVLNLVHEYMILSIYAGTPLYNTVCFLYRWPSLDTEKAETLNQAVKSPKAYRAGEIFDIICNASPDNAYIVLTRLSEHSDVYEHLCQAYINKDKEAFIQVMSENKCNTKAVTGICSFLANYNINNRITEIKTECIDDKDIAIEEMRDVLDEIQSASGMPTDVANDYSKYLDRLSIWTNISEENLNDEFIANLNSLIEQTENMCKGIYFEFLDCEKDNTPKEQEVLDQITTRPEVADYFKRWRKEYENQKNESLSTQKQPKTHPQFPIIPGINRGNIQLVNRLFESIKEQCLFEPNQNFAYFFNAGEWNETEGEYLKWKCDWLEVSYLLRVLYSGQVKEKDGKECIVASGRVKTGVWDVAKAVFRDKFSAKPGETTLKNQTFEKLSRKYSIEWDPILIPFLKEIGR